MDQAVEQSVEDRMLNLLESPEIEEEAADPETEDAEVESDEEDSQEEPEAPVKLKLTRNGEEIEVDLEEAKNLAQQGYDYTQKTQKLAEERKQVEIQAQAIKAQEQALIQQATLQQAFIQDIAKVTAIDEQLAQYEKVDWNTLSDTDPVQAQKLYIQYQQLQNNRTKTANEIQQKQAELHQQQATQNQARLVEARAELLKAFPNWSDSMAKELRDNGKNYGYTDQELSQISDPRAIRVLHDAAQYRKLQAEKGTVTNKVQGKPPVVKPGSKDTTTAARSKDRDARIQLRKTGDPNIAAALIERML